MSVIWEGGDLPPIANPGLVGWFRFVVRILCLFMTFFIGVIITLIMRLVEWPCHGANRPWTSHITQTTFRLSLIIIGLRYRVFGMPMVQHGGIVANHSSWLDIFVLNSVMRIYFVSKAEVAKWPGIGFLASFVNTVFIERDRRQAQAQTHIFQERLLAGHKLVFFPEGTSTDGMRVIPFKSTLFQSFMAPELKDQVYIQPVTVIYHAPEQADSRIYGWWGEREFAEHFAQILAAKRQGSVDVHFHDPVAVKDFDHRKDLALHLEQTVRSGMPPERQISG